MFRDGQLLRLSAAVTTNRCASLHLSEEIVTPNFLQDSCWQDSELQDAQFKLTGMLGQGAPQIVVCGNGIYKFRFFRGF